MHLGLITGDQMIALADLAESLGGDVRLTRQQNFVLDERRRRAPRRGDAKLAEIGLPLDAGTLRGDAVACTGEPHCNFSVTETKSRMDGLVQLLEERFGKDADGLRLNLDGCPHACAQHWVGEIGFQGTTVRDAEGKRRQAYDVYLRGSLDRPAAIARPVFKRVPTEELDEAVVGLVGGWVDARGAGETFRNSATARPTKSWASRRTRSRAGRKERHERRSVGRSRGGGARRRVRRGGARGRARVGDRALLAALSISTAFQTDGAVLLHMAYEIDPSIRDVQRRHRPAAERDVRADRADARALSRSCSSICSRRTRAPSTRWSRKHGPNLFYKSVENRLLCCQVRKVLPLQRHLAGLDAWITGLRRDQWATRSDIRKVEIDHDHGAIVKLNPLAEWSEEEVWDYVREHELPYNSLYDKGYTSIGCAPCTRPTNEGEDLRAGRWWWETNAPKECGIHCAIETGGLEHELRALIGR